MKTCARVKSIATMSIIVETEVDMSEEEFNRLPEGKQKELIEAYTEWENFTDLSNDEWAEGFRNAEIQETWTVDINTGLPPED